MDKKNERVFVGCRSGAFAAVDGNTGKVIATLPIGPGVDALEFDPAKGLIYVSSGGDGGSLSIFHEDAPDKGQFGPAPAGQRGRGPMVPGTFHVLVFGE